MDSGMLHQSKGVQQCEACGGLVHFPANIVTQRVVIISQIISMPVRSEKQVKSKLLNYWFSTFKLLASAPANEVLTLQWFLYGVFLLVIDERKRGREHVGAARN